MTRTAAAARAWPRTLLLAVSVLVASPWANRTAQGGLILTASLEEVVEHSTHVVFGTWDAAASRLTPERWLRGQGPCERFLVHGVPDVVAAMDWTDATLDVFPTAKSPRIEWSGKAVLFLEALDGRLYLTGLRRYGGFSAHASIRYLTKQGRVLRLEQRFNPGFPAPSEGEGSTWPEFEKRLGTLLDSLPYRPSNPPRTPIPEPWRDAFFRALGPTIDWYQGGWFTSVPGWGSREPAAELIEEAVERLSEWTRAVPEEARIHGLDALMLLAATIAGRSPDGRPAFTAARSLLSTVDPEVALAWILRELRHGGCAADRVGYAQLAQELGPAAFERAVATLETCVEEVVINAGTCAWCALKQLGFEERAEAAMSRGRKRLAEEAERRRASPGR